MKIIRFDLTDDKHKDFKVKCASTGQTFNEALNVLVDFFLIKDDVQKLIEEDAKNN